MKKKKKNIHTGYSGGGRSEVEENCAAMGRVVPADGDAWRGDGGKRIQQRRDDGGVTSRVNCYSLGLHRTSPRRGSGARGSLAGVASGTGSEDRGLAGWEHLFRVGTNRFTAQKKKKLEGGEFPAPEQTAVRDGAYSRGDGGNYGRPASSRLVGRSVLFPVSSLSKRGAHSCVFCSTWACEMGFFFFLLFGVSPTRVP